MQFIRRWFRRHDRRGSRRRLAARTFPCPHCGADVPGGRTSCPACGASDSDGWGDEAAEGGAGDGESGWGDDSDFDYEEFVEREFGSRESGEREVRPRYSAGREPVLAFPPSDLKRLVLWIVIVAFAVTLLLPLIL